MNTLNHKYLIKSVGIGKDKIFVELIPEKIVTIPLNYTEKLKKANIKQLENFRIIGNGVGIYFEDIDEDISVDGIVKDFIDNYQKIVVTLPNDIVSKLDEYAVIHHYSIDEVIHNALNKEIKWKNIVKVIKR